MNNILQEYNSQSNHLDFEIVALPPLRADPTFAPPQNCESKDYIFTNIGTSDNPRSSQRAQDTVHWIGETTWAKEKNS